MSEASRITPDMVIEAYKKTGMKPARHGLSRENGAATCPLGALYLAENAVMPIDIDEIYQWATVKFGPDYPNAFWRGFDNVAKREFPEHQGRFDGVTVYNELHGLGMI